MSILVVQLVPEGILLGADRNITSQLTLRDGTTEIVVSGQSERPKVLKWPNRDVVVGYVGAATLQGQPADQWLYAFIGRNLEFVELSHVAETLTAELDALYQAGDFDGPFLLHLGGFEREASRTWKPRVFFVCNTTDLLPTGAYVVGDRFRCSEELSKPEYFGTRTGDEIRESLRVTIFMFRQGYDLGTFGLIDEALRSAIMSVVVNHPSHPHPVPTTLSEWSKHVAFAVHGYGAYFAAFFPPFEQYVGGGADVVSAAWPD